MGYGQGNKAILSSAELKSCVLFRTWFLHGSAHERPQIVDPCCVHGGRTKEFRSESQPIATVASVCTEKRTRITHTRGISSAESTTLRYGGLVKHPVATGRYEGSVKVWERQGGSAKRSDASVCMCTEKGTRITHTREMSGAASKSLQ